MKIWALGLCLCGWPVLAASGSVLVGFVGVEPDTPIAGEEDLIVYNDTGATFGCSTPSGTPICTTVTFNNVVLTINGTTNLTLGEIAPGAEETYTLPSGVFIDGSITSVSLSISLSNTTLISDLNTVFTVDPAISLTGVPVDGSLAQIDATVVTPEPNTLVLLLAAGLLLWFAYIRKRLRPQIR